MTICLVSGLRTPGRDALEDDVRRVQRKRIPAISMPASTAPATLP